MNKVTQRSLLWTPAVLAVVCFVMMYWLPEFQYHQRILLRHQHFNEFNFAIKPILGSDKRFENVFLGEYTGGGRGTLNGFVVSTNDLEDLRKIYSNILSKHPAAVSFQVKVFTTSSN